MDDLDSGSYQMAISPIVPDDGLTSEGRPRAIRYKKKLLNDLTADVQLEEHKLTVEELCEQLQTDPEFGLMHTQAKAILERDGPNQIDLQQSNSIFSNDFGDFFVGEQNILTGVSTLLIGFTLFWIWLTLAILPKIPENQKPIELSGYKPILACILIILATVGCVVVSILEKKQWNQILKPFKKDFLESNGNNQIKSITVIREAQRISVDNNELVVGDLIELRPGDRMTADVRVIRSAGLKVDCSALTGHNGPQARCVEYSADSAFEAQNVVLAGSICVEGEAVGIIVGTGPRTVAARLKLINNSVGVADEPRLTPLQQSIQKLVYTTILVCLILSTFILIPLVLIIDGTWLDAFIFSTGFTMAIIPLSLPSVTSIGFHLIAKRLSEKKSYDKAKTIDNTLPMVLSRKPSALQALVNCQLAFIDKTGTLTQNRYQVSSFWYNGIIQNAEELHLLKETNNSDLIALSLALALCNTFGQHENHNKSSNMNSINMVERTLYKFAEKLVGSVDQLRNQNPRKFLQAFNSSNKLQITIVQTDKSRLFARFPQLRSVCSHTSGSNLLLMKGAPERILNRCSSILRNGKDQVLDDHIRQELDNVYGNLCLKGLKVIAFADQWLSATQYPHDTTFEGQNATSPPLLGLRLLGFISLSDTPRTDAYECIQTLQNAGIRPILITGDHSSVAKTFARQLGLVSINSLTLEEVALQKATVLQEIPEEAAKLRVVTGAQMESMQNQQIERLLISSNELLFARLEPAHKVQLIETAQQMGLNVIGMGDSINDLPMLRRCDVSIAIGGITGEPTFESNDFSQAPVDNSLANQCSLILPHGPGAIEIALKEARACTFGLRKASTFLLCCCVPQLMAFVATIILGLPMPLSLGSPFVIDLAINAFPALCLLLESPVPEDEVQNQNGPKSKVLNKLETEPRVIDNRVIAFSWFQLGFIQTVCAFFAYLVVMAQNGFWLGDLMYIRHRWDSHAISDLRDSVGQEWDFEQRQRLQSMCQTAYLYSIFACQIAAALVCRTRYVSSFKLKFTDTLKICLVFECLLLLFLIYVPGIGTLLNLQNLCLSWLFIPIPFVLLIVGYDELRKYIIRKNPNGWVDNELAY